MKVEIVIKVKNVTEVEKVVKKIMEKEIDKICPYALISIEAK